MVKKKILLIGLLVIIGGLAILSGQGENHSAKKQLANVPLHQLGGNLFGGTEYNLEDFLSSEKSYVKINGVRVTADRTTPVHIGDILDIHLEWALPNNALTLTTNDTFILQFPDTLTFDDVDNGPVKDGTETVGYYTLVNNKVTLKYTDEEFVKQSNITGTLNLSGRVTEKTAGSPEGGKVDLEIPGVGTIPVYVQPDGSLGINKTITQKIDADTYEQQIVVTSTETNTNVIIGDNMGEYLILNKSSIKIEKNGIDITKDVTVYYDQSFDGVNNLAFVFMLDKLEDGDKVVVTYQLDVAEDAFIWDFTSWEDQYDTNMKLYNLAGTRSDENPVWVYDQTLIENYKSTAYKRGYYDKDSNVVTWEIYVLPGEKGITIKDVLGENQTFKGYIAVGEADVTYNEDGSWNVSQFRESTLTITPAELINGYTFAPNPKADKAYLIVYQTTPTDQAIYEGGVKNKIIASLSDKSFESEPVVEIGIPVLDKELTSADENDLILTWNSVLTAPEEGLKNTIFRDILGTGLTLIEDSIKINGIAIGETEFEFTLIESGFEINFGDLIADQTFNISYDTSFDNSASTTFVNTAYVTAGNISVEDEATYKYEKKSNYITKYVDEKGTVTAGGEQSGMVSWQIDVDQLPKGTTKAVISDIIPEGMEYIEGSALLVLNKQPYDDYPLTPTVENGVITIDISDYIDLIQGDNGISIFLGTKLKELETEAKTYTNRAYITINDNKYPEVSASVEGKVTSVIDKEAVYNTLTAPEVEYTIELNQGEFDLDPNSDTLVLEDNMGTALAFVMGTLEINGQEWKEYTWDPDTRELTIKVPDEQSLTITYNAYVNLLPGEQLTDANAYNNVNLYGFDEDYTQDENIIVGEVLESSATSTGEGKTIRIYKYKDGIWTNPMEGAEFTLYQCEYEGSGDTFKINNCDNVVTTLTTGKNGYASYSEISHDYVYKLVETKTNEGYILDDTVYYFVYPGHDGTIYPDYIPQNQDTWTFYVNNKYSKTKLDVEKQWDDNNYKDRPESVTVYLKQNDSYVLENGVRVSKELNAGNDWQASFEDLDKYDSNENLYNYTVEESVPTNYDVNYEYENNGQKVIVKNTLTKGNLTIKKVVSGTAGEQDRDFTFKIDLYDEKGSTLGGSFSYTGSKTGTIKSGETVTLKHSESITINELPLGTKYKVTEVEANTNDYVTTSENAEGVIEAGVKTATFENSKDIKKSNLTIKKVVSGTAGEQDRDFTFKIDLYDEKGSTLGGSFNYTGSKTGTITSGGTVTLKHNESITISDVPVGTKYKVTEIEANTDDYVTTSDNPEGTILETGNEVNFINSKEMKKGNLTISKIVTGADGDQTKDFTFKIELFDENDTELLDSFSYTGSKMGTITSGGTVTLKHNESITISDVPVGTKYKVTEIEANTDDYVTTSTNPEGTILETGNAVNFINHKEIPRGDLTISKIVSGPAGDQTKDFTFKVELFDANNNVLTDSFNYTGSKTGTITSGAVVTLKHGESVTITGLPVGTKYKVTEIEANTDDYVTTSENNEGVIESGIKTTTFENFKDFKKSELTINKVVTGADGDQNKYFTFKVELFDKNGSVLTGTFTYTGSKTGTITSGDTITLKHGESITITGLPVGTKYKVTEIEANTDDYVTTSENAEGAILESGNIVNFINHKEIPRSELTINKVVTGTDGDQTKDFTFKVELFDKNGSVLTGTFTYTGSKTGTIKSGDTITLKHGESITITGLPVGTKYKVTEIEANTNGYVTTSENAEGVIDNDGEIVKFINYLEKKQEENIYIPKTGVEDNTIIYSVLAFVTAVIFTILYRRKENVA